MKQTPAEEVVRGFVAAAEACEGGRVADLRAELHAALTVTESAILGMLVGKLIEHHGPDHADELLAQLIAEIKRVAGL